MFGKELNPMAPIIRLFIIINTLIHVLMYTYYWLSSYGPAVQKHLWWKKYITLMQIIQFIVCGSYGVVLYFLQTGYPMGWFVAIVGQNPIFIVLFYRFYSQSYKKKKSHSQ